MSILRGASLQSREGNHDVVVAGNIQRDDGAGMIHAAIFHALGGYKAHGQKVPLIQPRAGLEISFLILSFNKQDFGQSAIACSRVAMSGKSTFSSQLKHLAEKSTPVFGNSDATTKSYSIGSDSEIGSDACNPMSFHEPDPLTTARAARTTASVVMSNFL